jgi:hypothetical protein
MVQFIRVGGSRGFVMVMEFIKPGHAKNILVNGKIIYVTAKVS